MSDEEKLRLKPIFDNYLLNLDRVFVENDPISIPHRFSRKQDIEIAGFFAAIFAWGRRDIIISKASTLMDLFDNEPYEYVLNYSKKEEKNIKNFKHRTFNDIDLDFYVRALQVHYKLHDSLETAFRMEQNDQTIERAISNFYSYFSSIVAHESRSLKHISTPAKNAACKRICMYLRWMVRKDEIDFGIWNSILPSQLVIPLDVHVMNIASNYHLISKVDKPSWKTALKLTEYLKLLDSNDPIKYDLVLFSLGIENNHKIKSILD